MKEYLELEKVLDDSHIITVQTRDYGSLEVVPVEYLTNIPSTDVQPIDVKEILKHLDSLMICVGNVYNTSHYLLESDMEFIEKQEKFIRELLSNKI